MTNVKCFEFKLWLESIELDDVPPEPGSTPIPPDSVRLYHYITLHKGGFTEEQAAIDSLKKNGIDIKLSRGSTYGEPNVVWGSTQKPHRNKIYVEFAIPMNDPRWLIGKPRSQADVDWLNKSGGDVTFGSSIKPEEIIAIHMPWHHTYRYLVSHNMIPEVLAGEYDYLLDKPDSDEARAIQYIKAKK